VALVILGPAKTYSDLQGTRNTVTVLFAGTLNALGTLFLTLGLASDPNRAGPITAMLPLNSLFTCSLGWFFLQERLRARELAGIGIVVCGPIIMSPADSSGGALRGLLLSFLAALSFGVTNFIRKLATKRGAANNSVVVFMFLVYCLFAVAAMATCGLGGLTGATGSLSALSGALWVAGGVFFQFGLVGKAGTVSAIANANSVGVFLLSIIFFQVPSKPVKMLGMFCCTCGNHIALNETTGSSPNN